MSMPCNLDDDFITRLAKLEAVSPLHCQKIDAHDGRLRMLEGQMVKMTTLVTIGSAVGGVLGSVLIKAFLG